MMESRELAKPSKAKSVRSVNYLGQQSAEVSMLEFWTK